MEQARPAPSSAFWRFISRPSGGGAALAYDYYVYWARIVLSTVSVTLFVTLVLWPTLSNKEVSFTLSYDDVATGEDKIRMKNLRYVGSDGLDRQFVIRAASGVQDSPEAPTISLTDIEAAMELDGGVLAELVSGTGTFIVADDVLALGDEMLLTTTDGYEFHGGDVRFDLKNKVATGAGGINGSGPFGDFSADEFEVKVNEGLALFEKRVSMRVYPEGRPNKETS